MPNNQNQPANVIIIGLRASGKSTVGRALALALQRVFIDLDLETLRSFPDCESVSHAWRLHGEGAWRSAEAAAIQHLMSQYGQVIALGGGTPMIASAFELLSNARDGGRAVIVYLRCEPEVLRNRLRRDNGDRPALRGSNLVAEVDQIMRERDPVYQRLASAVIDAAPQALDVVNSIVEWLRARKPVGG